MDTISEVGRILARSAPELDRNVLDRTVRQVLNRKDEFLQIAAGHGSPLYLFDPAALRQRARTFRAAFEQQRPGSRFFFAMKSNSYPGVSHILVEEGYGLDVSSGVELEFALRTVASRIIFSGPGKTNAELELAVRNAGRVTILADSAGELDRIEAIASQHGTTVRVGVRLTTEDSGIWRKFGVPLATLSDIFNRAETYHFVQLHGLQFHVSWNLTPERQSAFISRLGETLTHLPAEHRAKIEFIDVGGGFWPDAGEWMQFAATPQGMISAATNQPAVKPLSHYVQPSSGIGAFATSLTSALKENLPVDLNFTMYTEPGRWLCHDAMHILLTVIDRKADDVVITDGGTNAIGWDRFETDYFPVVNLSRPSLEEKECLVAGSLCTPHDLWGYSYFGKDIQAGDILLIPSQGAYTWSLRQQFIKSIPGVAWLDESPEQETDGASDAHRSNQTMAGEKGTAGLLEDR